MKPTARRVLSLWRNNPTLAASPQEIGKALGLKKSQKPRLKTLLEEMDREGLLKLSKNRYIIAAKPPREDSSGRHGGKPEKGYLGRFSAHPDGFGFVAVEELKQDLFVPPRRIGGALDGDLVEVRPVRRRGDSRLSGRITSVLERRRVRVRGFVHIEHGRTWVTPLDEKVPLIFVEPGSEKPRHAHDDLVEAIITEYPDDVRTAPTGRITKVIKNPDAPKTIVENILADRQIPTHFPPEVLAEMKALPRAVSAGKETEGREKGRGETGRGERGSGETGSGERVREDLRELPFVTIDGEQARDFDDAVCLTELPKGGWRLLVSIADVAHFVRPGSAVDAEAHLRGTSVYLPNMVVPMLPELLSNDLCSLKPGVERLTLTCQLELDKAGGIKSSRIFESTIRSRARLTYEQVQRFFDEKEPSILEEAEPLAGMLGQMLDLSLLLAAGRLKRGALAFVFPEARFLLNDEGLPLDILKALPTPATRLIEQFMLEANEAAGRYCLKKKLPILYRVHDPPAPEKLVELHELLNRLGVETRVGELESPNGINRILSSIGDKPQKEEIELAILKSMTQAQYRPSNDGHFGLASRCYTHFTSPIRRYPDLLAHRALKNSLRESGKDKSGKEEGMAERLPSAGLHLSEKERSAADAETRAIRLYKVLYMEPRLGETFKALVSGVSARGLRLSLADPFVEGLLPVSLLPHDRYLRDPRRNVLRSSGEKQDIGFGERLTVQLARADRMTQELEFSFWDWGWEQPEDKKGGPPPKKKKPVKSTSAATA